jgi:hypothetical protein
MRSFWKRWNDVISVGGLGLGLLILASVVNQQAAEHLNTIGTFALVAALVVWMLRLRRHES